MNAIRQLLTEAVTVDNRPSQVYWFSRQSAYYLLAALELYAENYDKAEEYALKNPVFNQCIRCPGPRTL